MSKANEVILNKLIEKIEKENLLPWQCQYLKDGLPHNFITGRPYSGRNLLLALSSDYTRSAFMTYKQAKAAGYQVRKGEKGMPIVWASSGGFVEVENKDAETGEERNEMKWQRGGLALYYVFNVAQIDGINESLDKRTGEQEDVEQFLASIPVEWVRGKKPCYIPSTDEIQIPLAGEYKNEEAFYSTTFHELVHWTGKRLGREMKALIIDKESYSYEELVAEIGAVFLRGHFRIGSEPVSDNNAAYVKGWLTYLKDNRDQVLKAASEAQKAVDYLLSFKRDGVVGGASLASAS